MIDRTKIKTALETMGMSYRAGAIAAGWGEENASRIERVVSGDTDDPGFTTAAGIADALGLTMDELRIDRPQETEARSVVLEALQLSGPDSEFVRNARALVESHRLQHPPPVPARRRAGRPPRGGYPGAAR